MYFPPYLCNNLNGAVTLSKIYQLANCQMVNSVNQTLLNTGKIKLILFRSKNQNITVNELYGSWAENKYLL